MQGGAVFVTLITATIPTAPHAADDTAGIVDMFTILQNNS